MSEPAGQGAVEQAGQGAAERATDTTIAPGGRERVAERRSSPLARAVLALRRHPLGMLAGLLLIAGVLVAIFAAQIATHDPLKHDIANRLAPPSREFLMGTDTFGRDAFSRVLYGGRASLVVGFASVAAVVVLGLLLGTASGYLGGRFDLIVQRLSDTVSAFPALVLALILIAAFGVSTFMVGVAVVLALTPQAARLARARCLELKASEHVLAARALGASRARILFGHLLPHAVPAVLVLATGYVGKAMVLESALSYLGLGIPPPTPSWGRMIFESARLFLEQAPWLTLFPGLALTFFVLLFAVVGDALRDALDPRDQHRGGGGREGRRSAEG